jgi:hypothetical protein
MEAGKKGRRITRITRIKATDYTESGGGIERRETLSVLWILCSGRSSRLLPVHVIRVPARFASDHHEPGQAGH